MPKKITIKDPAPNMRFFAVDTDGEVIAAGRDVRYALSASPRVAAFIANTDGEVLAAALGGVAWVPTRAGLLLVTGAAEKLFHETLVDPYDDDAGAFERHCERHDPIDPG